jgi:hypothetical protein
MGHGHLLSGRGRPQVLTVWAMEYSRSHVFLGHAEKCRATVSGTSQHLVEDRRGRRR